MKFKIDKNGILSIQRALDYKTQRCPNGLKYCSDSCPLFGPIYSYTSGKHTEMVELEICGNKKLFCLKNEFIDERW